ncbi:hypothetical protein CFOL_v3_13684 [Cephalotus follicularis]|uniref:Uncharacterized protein n=1 Tax=Cephalotus follicularis TaxID=3775 RepID=A0A1Q3BQ70_CEPFO|nr:hypothetical protein CFOL_v3_13684 [Cephalotus follicularis]
MTFNVLLSLIRGQRRKMRDDTENSDSGGKGKGGHCGFDVAFGAIRGDAGSSDLASGARRGGVGGYDVASGARRGCVGGSASASCICLWWKRSCYKLGIN